MRFHFGLRFWAFTLFALLMAIGMGAVVGFFHVETDILGIPERDYRAALGAQNLLQRVANHQSRLVKYQAAEGADSALRINVDEERTALRGWFLKEKAKALSSGQGEDLGRLEKDWDAFLEAVNALQRGDRSTDREGLWKIYVTQFVPAATNLQLSSLNWSQLNERVAEQARARALLHCHHFAFSMVAVTFVGLLALLLFNFQLNEAIAKPTALISRIIARVNGGETHLRLPAMNEEHLSRIVLACNRMFESMEVLAEESQRRIASERQVVAALIESFSMPALVLDLAGELLQANAAARTLFTEADGSQRFTVLRECLAMECGTLSFEGKQYHIERRVAPDANKAGSVSLVLLHHLGGEPGDRK